MAFLNLDNLAAQVYESPQMLNEDVRISDAQYHVFISYRHQDRVYLPRVAQFLKALQAGIYIDFLDSTLAAAPNHQTAPILRTRINQSKKLIQLITPNSNASRWMPWELGLGDGLLGFENAVTLPAINNQNNAIEQDYLNMYGHIETARSRDNSFENWAVRYPNGNAIWFTDWLAS